MHLQPTVPDLSGQAGGGLLTVVATLGLILLLIQGTGFYRSKSSASFISGEKNKLLAMQMAEAGIEENIADLGKRRTRIAASTIDSVTYDHQPLGGGFYTSTLTTVATGPVTDTVDLVSTGSVGSGSQSIRARLKLKKYLDTTRVPTMIVDIDTFYTYGSHSVPDTARATTVRDPNSMPRIDSTPAYSACMAASAKKCDVCHLPNSDVNKADVININKSAIGTHISHHGDYVTTDGTCDLYKPHTVLTITYHMASDTTMTLVDNTTYDTTIVIDTAIKVQVLSWK
jgi:hypothetical protein